MSSLKIKTQSVGETEIGLGGTGAWKLCSVDPFSSYAFYFEIVNQHGTQIPKGQNGMIQFLTKFQHPSGQRILRVTTVAHTWADSAAGARALIPGFDQEATAALIARWAVWKSEKEEVNAIRWLDRHLIQLMVRFADFQKSVPGSFQTPNEMSVYPQFMFYLRRGPLIQVFNNSPDETVFFRFDCIAFLLLRHFCLLFGSSNTTFIAINDAFYRWCLLREQVSNCLVMIQPTLDSYTLDNDPVPVLLSATSVNAKNVMLLDTFFHIIIHYGDTIAQWRKAGYHNDPEYENLKELIEAPRQDAAELMKNRVPLPMYVECDQGTSQARFLLATIDPDVTHMTNANQPDGSGQIIFTEDVNLQVFIDYLKKRVVDYDS
jgi:protein transport protein SEC23